MKSWATTTIGNQVTLQRGFDITRKEQARNGSVPVVSSGGIRSYHNVAAAHGPGVVIGRKGSLGTTYYLEDDYWPHDTTLWVKDFKNNFPRFVYYFFRNLDVVHLDVGSANPTLNRNHVHPIVVDWPPIDEQRRIAAVLGALDDKIELNRKMNRTLEEMAQALFKSWFINFDGHEDFEDSKLGPIPRGWTVEPLDKVADFLNGAACQKYPALEDEASLPVIKIRELNQGVSDTTDRATADIPSKWHVHDGDVLFSWSGSLVVTIWTGGPGALNQHLFKVTSERFPRWFFYLWTKHHLAEFQRIAADKATTMGHIKRHHLTDAKCMIPPPDTLTRFHDTLDPIIQRQVHTALESRTLVELRDLLLPKLISGEIRVPETLDLP